MVLLDLASPRHAAVEAAVRMAQEKPATIELYDCGPDSSLPSGWADAAEAMAQYRALLRERRLDDLERLARPLRSRGIAVTTVAEENAPREAAIVRHIEQAAPDVIVKDSAAELADNGGWQAQTDGIVSRHARCPVLLVPTTERSFHKD